MQANLPGQSNNLFDLMRLSGQSNQMQCHNIMMEGQGKMKMTAAHEGGLVGNVSKLTFFLS